MTNTQIILAILMLTVILMFGITLTFSHATDYLCRKMRIEKFYYDELLLIKDIEIFPKVNKEDDINPLWIMGMVPFLLIRPLIFLTQSWQTIFFALEAIEWKEIVKAIRKKYL